MYNYFISYSYVRNDRHEYGCCELEFKTKIENFDNIIAITKAIEEKYNLKQVVITNFRLFNK